MYTAAKAQIIADEKTEKNQSNNTPFKPPSELYITVTTEAIVMSGPELNLALPHEFL